MKKIKINFLVFILWMLFPINVLASNIFSDDFDSCNLGCVVGGTAPDSANWMQWMEDSISATHNSVTHYSGEITSPGRDGLGKSLKLWRHSSSFVGSASYAGSIVMKSPGLYNNYYMRFYTKMPVELDMYGGVGLKIFRFNTSGGEIYLNILPSSYEDEWYRGNSTLSLDGNSGWKTVLDESQLLSVWDGNWHCWQFNFNLSADTVTMWIDGNQMVNISDAGMSGVWNSYLQHFPLGNQQANYWQNSWQAFEVDDLVIATTKAETDPLPTDLIFSESFENNNWSNRGWYDGTDSVGVQSGGYIGNALRWNWSNGATQPDGFSTIRNSFTQTDELFIEYYLKFDSGWRGSGLTYHPHMIHIQSTDDDVWQGLSRANNSLYLEAISNTNSPYDIVPVIATQDFFRVNTSYGNPPNNLVGVTETRSAYHCNTPASLSGAMGVCYNDGVGWYSANMWEAPDVVVTKNQWVKVQAYFKKNTFVGGVGNFDGLMQMWIDDELAIDENTVLYATNYYNDTEWDKVILAPWIGDGSPVNQTMWLDEFKIYDSMPSVGDVAVPSSPSDLSVL